jgi:hypothetical protein
MLLRGDGTKSLDFLRQNRANLAHGLGFTIGATESTAKSGLTILEETRIEIQPAGHFANWYGTLPEVWFLFGLEATRTPIGTNNSRRAVASEKLPSFRSTVGTKSTLLHLLQALPDLHQTLARYSATIPCSRISFQREYFLNAFPGTIDRVSHQWRLHNAGTPDALDALLEKFTSPPGQDLRFDCQRLEGSSGCIVSHTSAHLDEMFTAPSIREDMNLNAYMYARDLGQPEFVDAYMAAFGLSMLSRYYPDIWIACLESHCLATKLIDRFVDVMNAKGPLLCGRALTDEDLVITTQTPPWFA